MKKLIKYAFVGWLLSDELKAAKNRVVDFVRRRRNNPNNEQRIGQ